MFRRIFLAAIAAGTLAGALISAVQSVTTTPLILHAEEYENGGHSHAAVDVPMTAGIQVAASLDEPRASIILAQGEEPAAAEEPAAGHDHGDEDAWAPQDSLERTLYTVLTNILTGVGFALLVVAGFAVVGGTVTVTTGLFWGAAGYVVFTLAPALGLPPEVPGSMAADLQARQLWWLGAVVAAAVGLGLLVFARGAAFKVLGVIVAAVPHAVGAPQPEHLGGAVPPELAAHFAATAIVVSAIFWSLIGWLSAEAYRRLA